MTKPSHGRAEDIDTYIEHTRNLLAARRIQKDNANVHIWGPHANDLAGSLGLPEPYHEQEWRDYWYTSFVFGNKDDEVEKLQACIDAAEALKTEVTSSTTKGDEDAQPSLRSLDNPVTCRDVGLIISMRSDNVARTLSSRRYTVVLEGGKYYCDADDAAVVWPKWKKYWREKKMREEL